MHTQVMMGIMYLTGTAVRDLAFNLAGEALAYDVGVEIRLLHFENVDLNVLIGNLLEFFLEFVNFLLQVKQGLDYHFLVLIA